MLIHPWDAASSDTEWHNWLAGHDFGQLAVSDPGNGAPHTCTDAKVQWRLLPSLHRFRRYAVPRSVPRVAGRDLFVPNTERYSGQRGPNWCSSKTVVQPRSPAQDRPSTPPPLPGRKTGRSTPGLSLGIVINV